MINNLKKIFVLSLFVVCLLSLCSCDMLDEIKNKQVIFDEEYPETVEFRGEKYERITLNPFVSLNYGISDVVYAEKESFPLLLLEKYGKYSVYYEKNDLICVNSRGYTEFVYTHEDNVDKYNKVLENENLSHYKFEYYDYDISTGKRVEKSYILKDDITKIINGLQKEGAGENIPTNTVTKYLKLTRCDENDLIQGINEDVTVIVDEWGNYYVTFGEFRLKDGIRVPREKLSGFWTLLADAKQNKAQTFYEFYR